MITVIPMVEQVTGNPFVTGAEIKPNVQAGWATLSIDTDDLTARLQHEIIRKTRHMGNLDWRIFVGIDKWEASVIGKMPFPATSLYWEGFFRTVRPAHSVPLTLTGQQCGLVFIPA